MVGVTQQLMLAELADSSVQQTLDGRGNSTCPGQQFLSKPRWDSIPRSSAYKAATLPTELSGKHVCVI